MSEGDAPLRLLLHSAAQLVTPEWPSSCAMPPVKVIRDGALVVDSRGVLLDVGETRALLPRWSSHQFESVIDARGQCVLPGLVDAHTHPVWAGDRLDEFKLKIAGASYLEIHQRGGGIHYTVSETTRANDEDLYTSLRERLNGMLRSGTTLAEVKSGYGLRWLPELRLLRLLDRARKELPLEVSITHCGGHAVPSGSSAQEAVSELVDVQLPSVGRLVSSGDLKVDNVDVFCEKGAFDVEQSRRILLAGQKAGLKANFHADELTPGMGGAEMGASIGATAVSHLEEVSAEGSAAMAAAGTAAILLPTTALQLRLKNPPARRLVDDGVVVALGSDFNPNAYCYSMPVVMHLACVMLRLSPEEALAAATINGARALCRADRLGSLQQGKQADLLVITADRWEHLVYQLACHADLISHVIKAGLVVYNRPE